MIIHFLAIINVQKAFYLNQKKVTSSDGTIRSLEATRAEENEKSLASDGRMGEGVNMSRMKCRRQTQRVWEGELRRRGKG